MDNGVLDAIEQEFVLPRPETANPQLSSAQQLVPRVFGLYHAVVVPPPCLGATLAVARDPLTNEYCAAAEAEALADAGAMSLMRASGRPENYTTGSVAQVPFQPGGIGGVSEAAVAVPGLETGPRDEGALCTVPDGFDRGLFDVGAAAVPELGGSIDLAADRYGAGDQHEAEAEAAPAHVGETSGDSDGDSSSSNSSSSEIDKLVPAVDGGRPAARAPRAEVRREWAHMVDVAAGFANFHQLVPKLARAFPFELDVFQKRAVYHLERGDSVFVAAHTSAGKTVVAEYAVALSQLHMTKTIYTSPIKALSNQKFNDFSQTFGEDNVGILTGDVKIRPEAPCLIMTTEVLKNMLYRGADVLRDVEFVVFDECHYINDIERGVVWEEVIIMLPQHVSVILLSATVPNTREFAEWVGRTKKRDIYVISTTKRPVPLEHYLYVGKKLDGSSDGEKGLAKIVDQTGTFNSAEWRDAYNAVNKPSASAGRGGGSSSSGGRGRGRGAGGQGVVRLGGRATTERQGTTRWVHLVSLLRSQALLPAVVFAFSRKKCEEYAGSLRNLDFLGDSRRSQVHIFVDRCLKRLKPEDRALPQIVAMRDLLKRGIGVHHSGLLPIIKEIVELLFARGLVQCLFATETFAMGVNMPAKCVVFSGLRKHDGRSFRDLLPGEYTQMAGRAGRRGLDKTGVVIIDASSEVPDSVTLHAMILGPATRLESQFYLTYTMILNLLRAKQLRVEEVIKRSFGESATQGKAPEHEQRLLQVKARLDGLPPLGCAICEDDIAGYYGTASALGRLTARLHMKAAHRPPTESSAAALAATAFCPGRLAVVSCFPRAVLAVVVKKLAVDGSQFACVVLDPPPGAASALARGAPPYPIADLPALLARLNRPDPRYALCPIPTSSVIVLLDAVVKQALPGAGAAAVAQQPSHETLSPVPPALAAAIRSALDGLCGRSAPAEFPWHRIRVLEFQELVCERARLAAGAEGFQCCACPDLASHFLSVHERALLQAELDELTLELSDQNLDLLPDYRLRLDVLKDLGYVDEMGNVQLKGRVACEMNSADALVMTELVLDNTLAQLEPEEIIGLISAFVCSERDEPADLMERMPAALRGARERVMEACRRVGAIQAAYGLPVSVEEYQREFRFGLMEVAYEWARGLSFLNIAALTEAQEGIIVRCIIRIADVLKNVMSAAMLIGDTELKLRLHAASELIRRDIVFAASLYF
ncbi:Antiviral helicase ski2 [Coemansia javaensis]|uniref:Antiviral helicase ski2 n=1 Tax=Coemansia javaensis TaxID=2761396 RepID=A0A9W8H7R1_9FUNG|nr:Antiviral helicase ski2 [Coemansia javaensis]